MQLLISQFTPARLLELARRFGAWWLKEFLDLFPKQFLELVSGRERTLLAVAADGDGVKLRLVTGAMVQDASQRVSASDGARAAIDRFLVARGLERHEVDIGLQLPGETVFVRRLLLPTEARDAIETIVDRDLANKTPFKIDDIYYDYVASEWTEGEKIKVWQWVIRRQFVHQALASLRMGIEDIAFVVFDSRDVSRPVPLINLRRGVEAGTSWNKRIAPILWCSALVLALVAGGLKYWNQQIALDRLDAEIVTTGGNAQRVRALVDQLKEKRSALLRLRLERSELPGLVDLWDETTRVLPPHSWLTEFRLVETTAGHDQQVTMIGFSGAAPSLVAIIDGSPLFVDASLTSPVAFDAMEGRERFALQARVRLPDMLKEAGR
jgi:general secretion pathway protein L